SGWISVHPLFNDLAIGSEDNFQVTVPAIQFYFVSNRTAGIDFLYIPYAVSIKFCLYLLLHRIGQRIGSQLLFVAQYLTFRADNCLVITAKQANIKFHLVVSVAFLFPLHLPCFWE